MKRILTALILIFLLNACREETKENNKIDDSLSFNFTTIEKSLDNCLPENGECTFISLNYPVAKNSGAAAEEINKKIYEFISNTIDYQDETNMESPEELAANFIENYKLTAEEFPEYELPWEATISGNIIYKNDELICIAFKTDMFTGGAHGYRSTSYLNFDPVTGQALTARDLFTSDFSAYVEKDFRKKQQIPADSNINSTGMFFENDSFHLPNNVGITRDKVLLHYNAYEIAPYASGNFTLTYPKSEIQEFFKIKKDRI